MNLLADAAAGAATEEISGGAQIVVLLVQLLPMILIFAVFYFMLIRPQRKKDKEAKAMLDGLKVGDRICTIGGIYGTIVRIKDQVLTIEVGEAKTQMMIARWAVRNVEQLSVTNDAETLI
ncbi:MAG: preprotein translocase subunit YajC [Clostridia bacterium]|nr:preprotein translocase subunit YajC [Clostridia bacterium]